jgi:simple sugar transport system permease protein
MERDMAEPMDIEDRKSLGSPDATTPSHDDTEPAARSLLSRLPFADWRIERRPDSRRMGLYRVLSMTFGLIVAIGIGPLFASIPSSLAFHIAWVGTLGTANGIRQILTYAIPLVVGGLAVAIPLRLGRWNVGVDGQIYVGAWGATLIAFTFPHLAGPVLIPLMMVAGLIGGGLWILGPALARTYLGVSEIITTFLMNFVGLAWLTYWVVERWPYPAAAGGIRAKPLPQQALLNPINVGGLSLPAGVIFVVVLPLIVWAVMRFTRLGYEMRLAGASERVGRAAGIPVTRMQIGALVVGGALAGLAGTVDMVGNVQAYGIGLANSYGLAAVAVAVLGGRTEIGVLIIGLLYSGLLAESNAVSIAGVSSELVLGLIGFTLLLGAMGEAIARLRIVRTKAIAVKAPTEAQETEVAANA